MDLLFANVKIFTLREFIYSVCNSVTIIAISSQYLFPCLFPKSLRFFFVSIVEVQEPPRVLYAVNTVMWNLMYTRQGQYDCPPVMF